MSNQSTRLQLSETKSSTLKLDMMNDDVIGLSAVEIVTHPPKLGDDEGGHTRQNRRNFTEDRDVKMMGHGSPNKIEYI
jgi:hypothetical protein